MSQPPMILTAAEILAIRSRYHSCGWDGPPLPDLNPDCGCMCGTTYTNDGEPIIARGGRNGMRCTHADQRGRSILPFPIQETK